VLFTHFKYLLTEIWEISMGWLLNITDNGGKAIKLDWVEFTEMGQLNMGTRFTFAD
jgi:hypothetical protein